MALEKITLYSNNNAQQTGPSILLENLSVADVRDVHCEQFAVCVKLDTSSSATVNNIWGNITLPTIVQFTAASGGGIVNNLFMGGSSVGVDDQLRGIQVTAATVQHLSFYSSASTYANGQENLITTAPGVPNFINSFITNFLTAGPLKFQADPTGGSLLQTPRLGMLLQSSLMPAGGYTSGGLQLIGNGYLNDSTWGGMVAGATTDLGTYTARGTSANSVLMQNGTLRFTADANLTAGSTFSPTSQFIVGTQGALFASRSSDPGCTSAVHVGRMWMNSGVSPNVLSTCIATGAGFGWTRPVDQGQLYTNPSWLNSLAWSKITGAPNVYGSVALAGSAITQRATLNFGAPFAVADNSGAGTTDVTLPQASGAASGFLAAADWNAFNGKAGAGTCTGNNFVQGTTTTGATCVQPGFANLAGTASKTQQNSKTVYLDQSNTYSGGTQDFSTAVKTKPFKSGTLASMPTSCTSGEMYLATDQSRDALKQCVGSTFQNSSGTVTSGLLADYWMSNCDGSIGSGTVLADCSGSGNAATVTAGGNPAWTSQGLTWSVASNAPVTLPTAVLNGFVTVQLYADMSIGNNYNNNSQIQSFLSAGSTPVLWGNVLASTPLCCGLYGAWNNATATQSIDPAIGPNLFTYILNSTNDTLCIGANCSLSYYSRAGNIPASRTGPLLLGGNNATGQMNGTIYRALFYNRALSASEVAQNDAAIDGWIRFKGVTRGKYQAPATSNNLICIGDSITQGKGATPACSGTLLTGLSDTFQIYNMGMSGEFLANMLTVAPKFATGINPNGRSNIAWIFAGTNDMCVPSNTLTPGQTFQKLTALSRYMQAQGAKVIIIPMLSRTGSYQSTTCDTLRGQYNSLIAQNWPGFASAFAYGVLNDANLTADNAYSNTTYFQADGIHPTTAGQTLIAGYAQAEINNLLTGTINLAGVREAIVNKAANYVATMGDSVILCNAATAPVTITLPSAVGIQGRSFQVKKTDSSANACTIATTASQTIDGVTTSTLTTQYASRKMESDNARWQVIQ